jgi:MFS family permease
MAALGIPFGVFITFLPLFAEEHGVMGVGVVYSLYAGTILLAQPIAGWVTDRVGRLGVITPGLLLTGLAMMIVVYDPSMLIFLISGVIFGVGGGLVRGGVDPLVQDSVPSFLRGTAAAIQYTSFDFWIGMGSYPLGILADAVGYGVTFVITGALAMVGGGAVALVLRQARAD